MNKKGKVMLNMKTPKMLLIEEKTKKDIRDYLIELYIEKDLTFIEIIEYLKNELNVKISTGGLHKWFKALKIPTRVWSLIGKR